MSVEERESEATSKGRMLSEGGKIVPNEGGRYIIIYTTRERGREGERGRERK